MTVVDISVTSLDENGAERSTKDPNPWAKITEKERKKTRRIFGEKKQKVNKRINSNSVEWFSVPLFQLKVNGAWFRS